MLGVVLVFLGATMDALASRNQSGIRKVLKPEPYQFMFFTCFWVAVLGFTAGKFQANLTLLGQIIGENTKMLTLFLSDNSAVMDQLQLSGLNVLGQVFIYLTISWIGPIYLALITTTRKIFSVLCSVIYFGHTVDNWRATGIAVVTIGIMLEMAQSIRTKTR
jgi:UDP-galactose transporter B1